MQRNMVMLREKVNEGISSYSSTTRVSVLKGNGLINITKITKNEI